MTNEHRARMSRVYGRRDPGLVEELDRSLGPRGPDMLLELAGEYLRIGTRILDIGCRDARYLIRLVQAHDCSGFGFDPVEASIERGRAAVREAGLGDRIELAVGVMERIDRPDEEFDLVWCRDVLPAIEGLEQGLAEAARVLKRERAMVLYTNFATPLLGPGEAAALHGPLGNIPANLDEGFVEAAFARAGLRVERKEVVGTEWREHEEEREGIVSRDLLRLARLRRRRDEIVERYGQDAFELFQASVQWRPYQLLGKLQPVVYVLRRT